MSTIDSLSDAPKYSIKAVCMQTGIRAVTLRAWERRYNLLAPHRTPSNYRLYSERDMAIVRWLKGRVDNGMSISRAAAELIEMRENGKWPDLLPGLRPLTSGPAPNPPVHYAERLYKALIVSDESAAGAVLSEAHSVFDLPGVCLDVISPCLVMIGEAWHRGDILIAVEHLASSYLRGRLMAHLLSFPARRGAPRIVVACAPNEQHEIGSLMLAVLLRRDGYRVDYLGPGLPIEDLVSYVRAERPALVCVSASSEESARVLKQIYNSLASARPAINFGYGGRIFNIQPAWRDKMPGIFLGENVCDAQAKISRLIG